MAAAIAAIGLAAPAGAGTNSTLYLKLERVEVEPYFGPLAKVKLYLNPLTIEGGFIQGLKPTDLKLELGGSTRREVPGLIPFEYTDAPLDLVIVLQTSQRLTEALNDIEEPLGKLLGHLPKATMRVGIVAYGGEGELHTVSLGDPARAARFLTQSVVAEDVPERPALLQAIDRAIKLMKAAQPPQSGQSPRRLMLIISDGSNLDDESGDTRDDVNKRWKAAAAEGISIHTIAFSMNDHRAPYQNLGQLSKKTGGTFRWARDRASFVPEIVNFEAEIRRQLVLTYFLPPEVVVDAKVRVVCKSASCGEKLASNDKKAPPQPSCAGMVCSFGDVCVANTCMYVPPMGGQGHLGRNLALGALVVVGAGAGTAYARKRKAEKEKQERALRKGAAPEPAGPPRPQVVIPDFSNVPYLSGSAQNAQLQALAAQMNAPSGQPYGQQPPAQQAIPVLPPHIAGKLFVLSGPRQGQQLPLRQGFTIGKTPGCDLIIDDGFASGYHAQFHFDAQGVTIVDMNSTNGTFVNGVRTARQRLGHGMTVRIGQTELRYLQGG
jgi:FHA domain/von Willebrand factor type A domain